MKLEGEARDKAAAIIQSETGTRNGSNCHLIRKWRLD